MKSPPPRLSSWLCSDLSGKLGLLSRMHLVLSTAVLVLLRTKRGPLCFLSSGIIFLVIEMTSMYSLGLAIRQETKDDVCTQDNIKK